MFPWLQTEKKKATSVQVKNFLFLLELICRRRVPPPAWGGQNGLLPVKLVCWFPSEAQSRSVLP